jgi:hypothetical protein
MMKEIIKNNKGFVMLFAVTISAILLAIALGVANIALQEVKFGTSAIDTNNAFFAADTSIETVLFADKPPGSPFVLTTPNTVNTWPPIYVFGLGSASASCGIVTITKDNRVPAKGTTTQVVSKGYNVGVPANCTSSNPDRVEREIQVNY